MTPDEAIDDLRAVLNVVNRVPLVDELTGCRDAVYGDVRQNFESRSAPDGGPWPPRKPRPDDDGHPLLEDTGFLRAAATGQGPGAINDVQARELVVGVDDTVELGGIPGAAVHNYGYGNIPERHFMAAREETLDRCGEIIGDGVLERIG